VSEPAEALPSRRPRACCLTRVNDRPRNELDSAADRAGLKRADVIVAIDGIQIHGATQVRNHVGLKRIGQPVSLTVEREGSGRTLTATIQEDRRADQR
jgi:S1-C subfamily serine protease